MGSLPYSGGTTTSFSNTPQAKDDTYSYLEDVLRADGTLYNSLTNTITLDVMSNDLGGNAKSLFSVDLGDGVDSTTDYTLVQKDNLDPATGASPWEPTLGGNWVRIVNGKIEFRISDGSGIPGQGRSVDTLSKDEPFHDEFVYAIRLGNGTLSEAKVSINILGSNDGPTAVADTKAMTENQTVTVDVLANDTDPDADHVFTLVSATAPSGKGTATVVGNQLQFDPGTSFDHLAQGATEVVVVTYTMKDQYGQTSTSTLTLTITGTNDGPVANADTGSTTENASVTIDVLANDTDVDDGHVLTVTGASTPVGQGSASVVANKVVFNPGTDYDHLAQGATTTVVVTYDIKDEYGATSTSTATITITGTNDGPVANVDTGSTTENASVTVDVLANDTDLDDGHVLTVTSASTPVGQGSASIVANKVVFNPGSDFDYLAVGECATVTVSYTIQDEYGASSNSTATITIKGTNDDPVISVETGDSASAGIDETDGGLTASGTLTVTDVDTSDTVDVAVSSVSVGGTGGDGGILNATLLAMLDLTAGDDDNAADGTDGSIAWSFDSDGQAFDYLAAGETLELTYTLTATDVNGGSDTQTVTITITGTNDAAIISGDTDKDIDEGAVSVSGNLDATDVDGPEDSFVAGSGAGDFAYGSYSVNEAGEWTYTLDNSLDAVDSLAVGETLTDTFTVVSTDGASQLVTITIKGTNDDPVISVETGDSASAGIDETDAALTASGTLTVSDVDTSDSVDIDVSSVSVGGTGGDNGIANATLLAMFSLTGSYSGNAADGTDGSFGWSFDSDTEAFDYLADGETLVLTYTLTATDGNGGSDTQTVEITITGTNDQPTLTIDDVLGEMDEGNGAATLSDSGSLSFADADATDAVLVSATYNNDIVWTGGSLEDATAAALIAGFSVDQNSWDYSVSQDLDFLGDGETITLTFDVVATDDSGEASDTSAAQTVTITITGTNDEPVLTSEIADDTTDEDSLYSYDASANFADVDHGDTLTYSATLEGGGALPSWLSIDPDSGVLSGTPANGDVATYNITVTATDALGASKSDTFELTVNNVNDAPLLDATKTVSLGAILEDAAAPSGAVGTLVSSLVDFSAVVGGVDNVVDVDAGAVTGIAVTGLDSTNGTWFYSIDGGTTWLSVGTVSNSSALLLSADARLYFQPDANFNGTLPSAVTFHAWDQTSGTEGTKVDVGVGGGTSAFSTASDTASLTITAVNDAPTASNLSAAETYTEDTPRNLTDIVVSDIDSPNVTVTLTLSNLAAGALSTGTSGAVTSTYDPVTGVWTASGAIADVNALLAAVTFNPAPNFNGSFTVATSVSDGEATITGSKTFTGIAVNDAPTATNLSAAETYTEDTPKNLTDIVVADVDSAALTVTLTLSNPAAGALSTATSGAATSTYDPATGIWTVTGSAAEVNALLANLTFNPAANYNGNFTIATSVSDGVAAPVTGSKAFTGIAVNDAPTATNLSTAEAYTEDTPRNLTDIVVADVDGDALTVTLTLSNPAAGSLNTGTAGGATSTYDVTTGVWTVTGSQADVNVLLAALTFTPAPNFNGSFTVATSVSDGIAPPVTGTKTFTGTAVNDAPTATNLSAAETYTEDTPKNLTDIVVADVDSATVTVTLTLSNIAAGALSTGTSGAVTSTYDAATGVWTASGATADVNALLAALTFTPALNFNGNFTVATSVSDGVAAPVTGSKAFTGIAVNDAPTATNLSAAESYTEDTPKNLTDIVVADVDSPTVTVTLTLSNISAGALSTGTSGAVTSTYNAATGVWTASGSVADVNALLAGVTFNPATDFNGNFTIATSVSDGVAAALTGTKAMTGIAVDDGDPNDNDGMVTATTPVVMTQGTEGAQTLLGSTGNDVLMGGSGNDTMYGGAGDDFIYGYSGNTPPLSTEGPVNGQDGDVIYGGSGNDTIFGNQRDDVMYGGSGNDNLNGGVGSDQLWGGLGQDDFIFSAADESTIAANGRDKINDFNRTQGDKIDLTAFSPSNFLGAISAASVGSLAANGVAYVDNGNGTLTVYVDTNGVAGADMAIDVVGVASLQASDFLL